MRHSNIPMLHRVTLLFLGILCSLVLLAVLAGCVAVSGQSSGGDPVVEGLRQDVQSLQMTVTALDGRLLRVETTSQPTATVTPPPIADPVTWMSGGIALSYTPTITPAIALYPAHDIMVFRNLNSLFNGGITEATTIQLALLSPVSDTYDLFVEDTIAAGSPTAWQQYSAGIAAVADITTTTRHTDVVLGPALPIRRVTYFKRPINQDLVSSRGAIERTPYNFNSVHYGRLLLLYPSRQPPQSVLVIIDPGAPSGGDRVKMWCQKSCRFRWCNWFCRLFR